MPTKKTRLTWQSEPDPNCDYFSVERSGDGNNFTAIGRLIGTNTAGSSNYSFIDETPMSGKDYYRLKQFDKNGNYSYSNILLVDYSLSGNTFTLIPVPGKNQFNLLKPSVITFIKAILTLRNASGQTVLTHNLLNQTVQTISTNGLAKGIYFATVYNGKEVLTKKVVVD